MSEFLDHLLERAAKLQKTIALAEGSDPRVAKAAEIFTQKKIGKIVLIGNEAEIKAKYPEYKFSGVSFRDPGANDKYVEKYAKKLYELRKEKGMTEDVAMRTIKGNNMFYACTALKCGDVDGVVGGAVFSSADVSRAAFQVIKAAPGIKSVSSCFVMIPPDGFEYAHAPAFIFADCAVIPYPTSKPRIPTSTWTASCSLTPRSWRAWVKPKRPAAASPEEPTCSCSPTSTQAISATNWRSVSAIAWRSVP